MSPTCTSVTRVQVIPTCTPVTRVPVGASGSVSVGGVPPSERGDTVLNKAPKVLHTDRMCCRLSGRRSGGRRSGLGGPDLQMRNTTCTVVQRHIGTVVSHTSLYWRGAHGAMGAAGGQVTAVGPREASHATTKHITTEYTTATTTLTLACWFR